MQSYECVIISKMFLIYFISYGCNGGALVFLGGAEASASPSFALPMFITIKKIIILHLFLGVPAATVGGTGTPWHTRGYAPGSSSCTPGPPRVPSDLGEDKPNQVKLRRFLLRLCYNQHRSFVASWYKTRDLFSMQKILNFSIRLSFHCKGLQCLEARCRGGKRP